MPIFKKIIINIFLLVSNQTSKGAGEPMPIKEKIMLFSLLLKQKPENVEP